MKLRKRTILISVLAALAVTVMLLLPRGCQADEQGGKSRAIAYNARERTPANGPTDFRRGVEQKLMESDNHPVALYGKVVDQFGDPVAGATVEISLYPVDISNGTGPDGGLRTDDEGRFSISGLTGSSISATAMKDGYLRVPPLSSFSSGANLYYSGGDGSGDRHADPTNPVVLRLLKVVQPEPMIHVGKKRWKLPLDGTPRRIALDSEEGTGVHQIEFRFSSNWNKLPMDNEINSKRFDWSFELRVPGGGFAWDESDVKFEAPEAGYKEVVRYEHLATDPEGEWLRFQDGRYFVRFPNDTYGRIQFSIDGGSDRMPLYMESWLNLNPGSRNLATERMIIKVMDSKEPE